MSRRYDSSTTTFSPDGRLHQVEYAIEAINNAGTAVGILAADGIVLAGEKNKPSSLLAPSKSAEKMYKIDEHITTVVAGLTADANILIQNARVTAQRYIYTYQEPMPVEMLVKNVCNFKQGYTQYGGLRPFGVAFLFAGWDESHGYQLYMSDPSGNYSGWKATCIGQNNQGGKSLLKTEYEEGLSIPAAIKLAVKVLIKSMDATTAAADRLEFCVLSKEGDKLVQRILPEADVQRIITEVQAEAKPEGDE
jgi:20S proteasome subunit alpha 3